ncbi:hypothetical protein MNB_SUP05-SYMBIONT-5-747 [hydrothermal vent metagenome]|uniref:Ribosome maturation factor RimM PRC barrel domain-containing protein n=1 Tax=hydrothermal vent metagenome TaxID=652676 RepID=A0A1W1E4C6_9ZZZZ
MIGTDIYIEKSQLPKLDGGKHYWKDLIGLEVIGKTGFAFGKVENLMDTGSNHVIVVRGEKEYWIPYVEPFLIETNLKEQKITVDWETPLALLGVDLKNSKINKICHFANYPYFMQRSLKNYYEYKTSTTKTY